MRGISRRMAIGLLGLVAILIAGAAFLGPGKPATEPLGQVESVLSTTDSDDESESADRPVITLGDLDPSVAATDTTAPIDMCAVVDRHDLPIEARPAENPVRIAQPGADGGTGCWLEYRAGPNSAHTALTITTTWTAGPPDPAQHPGARPATFAGRTGLHRADTGPHGTRICLGLMPASAGTAAVRVTNSRYPTVDPCAVTAAVLTAIARKTP